LERPRTSLAVRAFRLSRLALHFARGLATVVFLFPRWASSRRSERIRNWSLELLSILHVTPRWVDAPLPLPRNCLLVLNHISWLDIFVVDALEHATFIAKSEIGRWPLAGTLVTRAGTLYIERGSGTAVRRANERIAAALTEGVLVACFPEGTTTFGHGVGRFHGALFQPAVDAGATVQPVALRYLDPEGRIVEAAGYVGDDSLMKSVWDIVSTPAIVAELRFLPSHDARGGERRALAKRVEAQIAAALAA
jgi:1-acyl-sn-glycerol-3-phosphate acyltransferase